MTPWAINLIVFAYLAGSIPFGLLLARTRGVDPRARGSGNIGATNVARVLGRRLGLITLALDVAKGYLPMLLASRAHILGNDAALVTALCGAAAVLGHMFPPWLRFRGGKGVATALGVFLFLSPGAVLVCLAVFVATVALSGYVSLGSLLGSAAMLPALAVLGPGGTELVLALFVVALIWIRHQANIRRLLRGEEKSWKNKEGGA